MPDCMFDGGIFYSSHLLGQYPRNSPKARTLQPGHIPLQLFIDRRNLKLEIRRNVNNR